MIELCRHRWLVAGLTVFCCAAADAIASAAERGPEKSADVIVYGGSPGGVAAAVAATRAARPFLVVE